MVRSPTMAPSATIAIIGAGPTGCYVAQSLRKMLPLAEITLIDSALVPFGLLRNGVAADHQGMKAVSRQFERLLDAAGVYFVGGVRVGRDVEVDALDTFDGVVIATGLERDRGLEVPVAADARVIGAGRVLRRLNGDASRFADDIGPLGQDVVIYGAGNVAVDLMRLIAKSEEELSGSDISDRARTHLRLADVRRITVLSRGAPRWDAAMFAELCALRDVRIVRDGDVLIDHPAPRVHIDIRCDRRVEAVEVIDGRSVVRTSAAERLVADSVLTALGFIAADELFAHDVARAHSHVVHAGGTATGALGNLAQNRALAKIAAAQMMAALAGAALGRPGFDAFRRTLPTSHTTFAQWREIDRIELAGADEARCRRKLESHDAMRLALSGAGQQSPKLEPITA